MDTCKSRYWLVPVLIVAFLLAHPGRVESQCNVSGMTYTMMFGATTAVYKILTAPANCQTTMMNALFCSPTAVNNTTFLLASAMGTASPSCAWSCDCSTGPAPHVVIDGSDGLPVELMEFSIED